MKHARIVFGLLAIAFALGAVFHAAALVSPSLAPDSPAWRHALFVAINLGAAAGMLTRPRLFVPAFAVLCGQQLASHGEAAYRAWVDLHRIDVASLAVLALMPLALALLVRDARIARISRARGSARSASR